MSPFGSLSIMKSIHHALTTMLIIPLALSNGCKVATKSYTLLPERSILLQPLCLFTIGNLLFLIITSGHKHGRDLHEHLKSCSDVWLSLCSLLGLPFRHPILSRSFVFHLDHFPISLHPPPPQPPTTHTHTYTHTHAT